MKTNKMLYGVAYYDEYMPYERLDKDVEMMKRAGINVVRIAESTWSTLEPSDGEFNFYHIDRVLKAMGDAGISVIVGTPTYAVPAWMVKKYPEIMVTTRDGRKTYGARQIMDITNKDYLRYCERVIRKLMEHVAGHPAVIGYQIDNETKHFGTSGANVQSEFVEYLKKKFEGDTEKMNQAYGLNYWSNAIHDWSDFPDVNGTINGSLGTEFEKFQRGLVTKFLSWQADIVREYKKENQFITHNFDFGWKGGSYGVQPDVNHYDASKCLDIAGCDIYHPSQSNLTGAEVSFCGDLTRSLKGDNYLVLETQAQGFTDWVPYNGQLRELAFSHMASGADMVEYWHWHSIHNSFETYWKGLLSHDMSENRLYNEAATVGNDLKRIGDHLVHLKKNNQIAFMVSNEALTALNWFRSGGNVDYNDVVRWLYDGLYEMNYECDFIFPQEENLSHYRAIILPALYSVPESTLIRLREFVRNGGTLIGTFKSCFTDENVKVYSDSQPHILSECFGTVYDEFTVAKDVYLTGYNFTNTNDGQGVFKSAKNVAEQAKAMAFLKAEGFMECLRPYGGQAILRYDHDNWGQYAAAVKNNYGMGHTYYFGCMFDKKALKVILKEAMNLSGIMPNAGSDGFPVIVKRGVNAYGKNVTYIFNYSDREQTAVCPFMQARELISGFMGQLGNVIKLPKWGFVILEEV